MQFERKMMLYDVYEDVQIPSDWKKYDALVRHECAKTPEEIRLINLAEKKTNEQLRRFGMKDVHVPLSYIHIIPDEFWDEEGQAAFVLPGKGMAIRSQNSRISFFSHIVHEFLHYRSLDHSDTAIDADELPVGLSVQHDGGTRHVALNEGITEEVAKRIVTASRTHSFFKQELNETKAALEKYNLKKILDTIAPGVDPDDVYVVKVTPIEKASVGKKERARAELGHFGYMDNRRALRALCEKVSLRNKRTFRKPDNVLNFMLRCYFLHDTQPLVHIIDSTFGEGTWNALDCAEGTELLRVVSSL